MPFAGFVAGQVITASALNATGGASAKLDEQVVSTAGGDIFFDGISQQFAHLLLIVHAHAAGTTPRQLELRFNEDGGASSYSYQLLALNAADGSVDTGYTENNASVDHIAVAQIGQNRFAPTVIWLPQYASNIFRQTMYSDWSMIASTAAGSHFGHGSGRWEARTEAVTSIRVYGFADGLAAQSVGSLYGLA
ncbi:MAG: hypothetical protein ACRDMV_18155 [Streptosporangiales bacterium]